MALQLVEETRNDIIQVDRLYTLKEAAQLIGLASTDWLYQHIHQGTIPYVDLNPNGTRPKYRLRASTINQLIQNLTINAQEKAQ